MHKNIRDMISYILGNKNSHQHHVNIKIEFDLVEPGTFELQLPSWRPGRYELGNFAKNILHFSVKNESGNELKYEKITKDLWKVVVNTKTKLIVEYVYYAAELNAGSTYVNDAQLYVNPVNCCMYNPLRINEEINLKVDVQKNYTVAIGLNVIGEKTFKADDFHELADSPFIASPTIKQLSFEVMNLKTHLWFQGECKPELKTIEKDFTAFMKKQLEIFGDCPTKEYHFLVQMVPYLNYHGVEHKRSTVIALGPGYGLNDFRYDEFLGVCCHEFYHVWNIKTIRPVEMFPYDYTKENYFITGFVAEGVTTYMGDYLLWQSGVFNTDQYFNELNGQIHKHADNFGRFNLSVAESGFDNWLDGYVPGVPDRKTSIYVEGCLLALMTDFLIMDATNCTKSLHDVMRVLYNDFYKKNKGYTYDDYVKIVNDIAKKDLSFLFENFAKKNVDYMSLLNEVLQLGGLFIEDVPSSHNSETIFGFKIHDAHDKSYVTAVYPSAPAYETLLINDAILSVNGFKVHDNANRWINYFKGDEIVLDIVREHEIKKVKLQKGDKEYYKNYHLRKLENSTEKQKKVFEFWKNKN